MKWLDNFKTFFTERVASKDFTLRMSQLSRLWDMGLNLVSGNAKGRPTQPYSQVDWVWICVNLLMDTCKTVPLMISNTRDEVLDAGPLYDFICSKPFSKLFQETLGYYILFREVYWVTLEDKGLSPTQIRVVGPDSMEPVIAKGVLVGYKLHLSGGRHIPLLTEDVYCIKNFNPYEPHRGCGPISAGSMSISTAYQASQYNESLLANGARLSVGLKVPAGVKLDDTEIRKLKSEFDTTHGGAAKAGKVLLMTGIEDIKTFSQTMADLQMVDLSKFTASTICSLFNVPPEVVGLNSEAQYAHGPATQRLILYGVSPLLDAIADGIDEGIIQKYRFKAHQNRTVELAKSARCCVLRFPLHCRAHYRTVKTKALMQAQTLFSWFDVDSHPAVQDMMRDRIEKLIPLADKGIPINQIIDANDLPYDTSKMPWGDHWWVPMGQVPAQWTLDAGPDALTGPVLPEGTTDEDEDPDGKALDCGCDSIDNHKSQIDNEKDLRTRIWAKYANSFAPVEAQYKSALRGFFRRQKADVLARLEKAFANKSADRVKADDLIARVTFDIIQENKKLVVIHKVFYGKASDLGVAQSLAEVTGAEGKPLAEAVKRLRLSPTVRNALAVSSHKITSVNLTTQNRIARQLAAGLEAGEGLPQLKLRIDAAIDTSSAATGRSGLIARTQTAGGVSAGRQAGLVDAGVELKGWLSAQDSAVRPTHKNADYKYADGIPVNQPFVIGSARLMYPGDPNATDVGEIANCRCALVPVIAKGKTWTLTDYDRVRFLTYTEIETHLNEVQHA